MAHNNSSEVTDKVNESMDVLVTGGENLIIETFPERILHLNELLSKPEFSFTQKDLKCTLGISTMKDIVMMIGGKKTVENTSAKDVYSINEQMLITPNTNIVEAINIMKPSIKLLLQDMNAVKIWVSLLIPKIEDGNNFGVAIQEDILNEMRSVEVEAFSYLDNISRYFLSRGKMISRVLKYPLVEDFWKGVEELDDRQLIQMCYILHEIRNRYIRLRDIVTKNIDKLKTPRSSNMENLY